MSDWDPFKCVDAPYSADCLKRIRRDISSLINDPPLGISVAVEDDDCTLLHAIVTGVEGTPYAGGFFHFVLKCTNQYPMTPPKVRFLTTGYGKVRFNPNMYEGGKVCLSILGTWSGQQWLPSCSLESVLISIQSIMTKNALLNEPGFDRNSEENATIITDYDLYVEIETLVTAVIGTLQDSTIPQQLKDNMKENFLMNFNFYEWQASYIDNLSVRMHKAPYYHLKLSTRPANLLEEIRVLKLKLEE